MLLLREKRFSSVLCSNFSSTSFRSLFLFILFRFVFRISFLQPSFSCFFFSPLDPPTDFCNSCLCIFVDFIFSRFHEYMHSLQIENVLARSLPQNYVFCTLIGIGLYVWCVSLYAYPYKYNQNRIQLSQTYCI